MFKLLPPSISRSPLIQNKISPHFSIRQSFHNSPVGLSKKPASGSKKKLKLSDEELLEKATPLLFEEDKLNYCVPEVKLTPTGLIVGPGTENEKNIDFSQYPVDTRKIDNVTFRNRLANMLHTACHIHKIFPSVVRGFMPRVNLNVEWKDQVLSYYGNELEIDQVTDQPNVRFLCVKKGTPTITYWTLLLIGQDVDRPSEEYVHWAVTNIPNYKVKEGQVSLEYITPKPLHTGLWRYTFLLCQQKSKMESQPTTQLLQEHGLLHPDQSPKILERQPKKPHKIDHTPKKTENIYVGKTSLLLDKLNATPKGISFFYLKSDNLVKSFVERNFTGRV